MDLLTQQNRTFERYEASRVDGLGECRGPKPEAPSPMHTMKPGQLAGSRVIGSQQQHRPAPANAMAAFESRLDPWSQGPRQVPANSLGACQTNCHSATTIRAGNKPINYRDAPQPSSGGQNNTMNNPVLMAQLERMERVQPIRGPKAPPYHDSQKTFQALQMTGKGLGHVKIIEWLGQDFKTYATPWEQKFSSLTYSGRRVYSGRYVVATPIIDQAFLVVAHVIKVSTAWCWVPPLLHKGDTNSVTPYLKEQIPVYVDSKPMDAWSRVGTSDNMVTVLVAIDGEVLQVQSSSTKASAVVYDGWMLDVLQLGGGAITSLGRAAIRRSVIATQRRTSKKGAAQLTGRTKDKAKKIARKTPKPKPRIGNSGYVRESGMPRDHFRFTQQVAREQRSIAIVRNTNNASTPNIARGCAAKKLSIKANTNEFGVVNVGMNKAHARAAIDEGYYIVDADGVARRTVTKPSGIEIEELKLDNAFWTVKKGQVITTGPPGPPIQPMVGDYDLMGVFPVTSVGSNVSLHSVAGEAVRDISGKYEKQFRAAANHLFDRPRMMHGAQDQFGGFRGGATVFFPDDRTLLLRTEDDVRKFYDKIGRKTAKETYNPDVGSAPHQAARQEGIESGKIVDMAAWKREQSGIID